MRHLLGLGAVLGLVACTTGPSTTSLKDLQSQIQAATKAAHDASIQEQAAALRNAGIVNPKEQHTADGVQVVLTTGHVAGIAAVGVSADGRYVISSDQTQVKVWEVASHSEVRSFGAGAGPATMAVNFRVTSGSCRVLLAAQSVIGTQSLRDCVTGNEIANAQLISEDGNSTVTDAMTRMREVGMSIRPNDSGLLIRDLVVGKQSNIPAPDGSTALGISANGQTLLTNDFDISAGGWRSTISGVAGLAGGIAQAVPGVGLVAALVGSGVAGIVGDSPVEETMQIVAWNVPTHRKLLSVKTSRLSNLAALSSDGRSLYVENKDRSIDGYDLTSGHKHRVVPADAASAAPGFVHDKLVLSADGVELARQTPDHSVEIFDTASAQKLGVFPADPGTGEHSTPTRFALESAILPVFSPDGKMIAVGSSSQHIHVREIATGRTVLQTEAAAIAFSVDGRTAILGRSSQGTPVLHDLTTGKEETFGVQLDSVAEVAVTADGKLAIATSVRPGGARLWDMTSGQLAGTLRTCPGGAVLLSARPSPTAGLVAAKCSDGSVALWDQSTTQWKEQLSPATPDSFSVRDFQARPAPNTHFYAVGDEVHFSADGHLLAVASDDQVSVWDLEAHTKIAQIDSASLPLPAQYDPLASLQAMTQDGSGLDPKALKGMSQSDRELMQGVAAEGKAATAQMRAQLSDPQYLKMIRDGQRLVTGIAIDATGHHLAVVRGGVAGLWDYQSGQFLRSLKPPSADAPVHLVGGLSFSLDGSAIYGPNGITWIVATGEPTSSALSPAKQLGTVTTPAEALAMARTLRAQASAVLSTGVALAVSPDGKLVARGVGQVLRLTDVSTGQQLGDLIGHNGAVNSVAFTPDGRTLISGSDDGSMRVWNIADQKEVVSFYALGAADYVAVRPDQYYRASKARLSGISFRVANQLYPFEQFDLRFNRPDLVAEGLGHASGEQIQEYRKAREHRLKKMGFTETMLTGDFHLPEAHIEGSLPPPRIAANSLSFKVRAEDSQYPLDRINVYVNDVPIFGTAGLAVLDRQAHQDERQVSVPVLPGANKIQVSALNQQGVESFKQTFYTMNSISMPPGDIYVVAIGVSRYQNPRYNLRFAAKDASDLMSLYSKRPGDGAHPQVHLLDLTNEHATRTQIHQAREWLAQAHPNDLAIVFAAGHGVTDARDDYYFGTYDIDAAHPEVNGLAYEEFETLLDGIPPLKKMLLLDTCFSGEIDKEETSVVANAATDGDGTVKMRSFRAARGVALLADTAADAAATPAAAPTVQTGARHFEDLFVDLRRGTGAVVISSASGNEYALEGERWNNGVFTYAVLSGLKDGKADANKDGVVTVGELQAYVIDEVRKLTDGGQNPTVRQENLDFDFQIY